MMSINSSGSTSGGGNGSGSNSGGGSSGGPCGACKFLRRKCVPGCIFAPYFDSEQGATQFAAVHKVFGASNVSKLLLIIPVQKRLDAVLTICYEAQARLRDPVYGCVAHIFALQQQVVNLQAELSYLQGHLATLEIPHPPPPQPPPPQPPSSPQATIPPSALSISDDLPSALVIATAATTTPLTYNIPTLFEPHSQSSWTMQHRPNSDMHQFSGNAGGDDDLQALARELLRRHGSNPSATHPLPAVSNAPSSHSPSK